MTKAFDMIDPSNLSAAIGGFARALAPLSPAAQPVALLHLARILTATDLRHFEISLLHQAVRDRLRVPAASSASVDLTDGDLAALEARIIEVADKFGLVAEPVP
jgi:hypothetical protein